LIQEEGILSLYKGNGANVLRIIPNYALKFALNDTFRDIVGKPNQAPSEFTFLQLLLSGSLSGLCTITAVYPLDVIRTRLALSESLSLHVKYKGITHCVRHVVQTEGFFGLYKGIGTTWLVGMLVLVFHSHQVYQMLPCS